MMTLDEAKKRISDLAGECHCIFKDGQGEYYDGKSDGLYEALDILEEVDE